MNKNWFFKNLGDAMLASVLLDDLEKLFQLEYTKSNRPIDMALFMRHESEGRLHCEIVAYFSPASLLIANKVGATPCSTPLHHDLCMIVGSEMSWSLLFPNYKK